MRELGETEQNKVMRLLTVFNVTSYTPQSLYPTHISLSTPHLTTTIPPIAIDALGASSNIVSRFKPELLTILPGEMVCFLVSTAVDLEIQKVSKWIMN